MARSAARPKTYKRNFLDKVVFRVDFEAIELGKLSGFSKTLETQYPFQEQKRAQSRAMKIDLLKGTIIENEGDSVNTWEFWSATRKKKLTISPTSLFIEYLGQSYTDKKELLTDVKDVVSPFLTRFGITTLNRIGLRYINNINLNSIKKDFEWKDYISAHLLGGISVVGQTKTRLSRAMTQVEIKYTNEDLRFKYGVWNVDYPNENTRNEFILDMDCYSRFPIESNDEIEVIIERYNANIQAIFEKSITNKFRDILTKKKWAKRI